MFSNNTGPSSLIENEGRINYGVMFDELKGLYQGIKFGGYELKKWKHFGFNLSNINQIKFTSQLPTKVPSFYKGYFNIDEVADTFLNPSGFKKGVALNNGFNVGRYWINKTQLTLYVTQYFLHKDQNEIVVFEIESQADFAGTMSFDNIPQIDVKFSKIVNKQ
mgnify:CR=1 FL=1